MGVSRSDIEHVAELARLDLTEEEVGSLTEDLNRILDYFERLSEVDSDGVEPAFSALRERDVLRSDVERASLSQEEALANAPDSYDGHFRVLGFLPEP
jgi:aspartyl-tRNA(Asn)/glutamyl-tRNA(Gln) amidotransferase subunit C